MSLILDALKKSEAERKRGQPPTLHAHFSAPRRVRRTPWVAGAGAVLLVAGLAGSGFWLARGRSGEDSEGAANAIARVGAPATEDAVRLAPAVPPTPFASPESDATQAPAAQTLAAESEATQLRSTGETVFGGIAGAGSGGTVSGGGLPTPQRAMLYTPSATPDPGTAATAPVPVPVSPPAPEPAVVAAPAVSEPPLVEPPPVEPPPVEIPQIEPMAPAVVDHGPSGPSAPEVAVSKPEEVLPVLFQLPYATRKDMPKLELSMHVFSPEPGERFIVLNGKRFTLETPAPGPDLTLLDIVADGAVFEYRGQRFLLPRQAY